MPPNPSTVSVTEPLSPALRRVKTLLFAPFDIRKWFIIGFCAWLSSCGETGGGGGGGGSGNRGGGSADRDDIRRGLDTAWQYVQDNLGWILPLVICVILLGVALWLVATWLNSRGKFMLLHCVALNRAEVQVPWNLYGQHAHSLFLFRILLGLLGFVILFPLVMGSIAVLLLGLVGHGPLVGPIVLSVLGILGAIGVGLVFTVVKKLLVDFVVPIMYLRTSSVRAAWSEFIPLLSGNAWRFVLYLLFSLVLAILIATLIFIVVIFTCCLAGCLMAIPYLGTVFLLPVFVFGRSYSLYYLEQYGPHYRVIETENSPPV